MSIAWATVAFIVVLLPGFFFYRGLTSTFLQAKPPTAVSTQLAALVSISLLVHVTLVGLLRLVAQSCGLPGLAPVDFHVLLSTLQAGQDGDVSVRRIAANVDRNLWRIAAYFVVAAAAGLLIGRGFANNALRGGRAKSLFHHTWVYEISRNDGLLATYAFVLTSVSEKGRHLMYRGELSEFDIAADGHISYVVLRDPQRFYLRLDPKEPMTDEKWLRIGASKPSHDPSLFTLLHIEGEDISNVVFQQYKLSGKLTSIEQIETEYKEAAATASGTSTVTGTATVTSPRPDATHVGTAGGTAFHRPECRTLARATVTESWSSRADAAKARTPCSVCRP